MGNNYSLKSDELAQKFHPGNTLAEKIQELGMSIKEFAIRANKPSKTIHEIIAGKSSITYEMAISFESVTHIPEHFWLNKQRSFDEYVAREKEKAERAREIEWAKNFPYSKMVEYGWIEDCAKIEDKVKSLLSFFRMSSMQAWEKFYMEERLKIAFRISLINQKSPWAVSAWLRQGEILSEQTEVVQEYSPILLKMKLLVIKEILYKCPPDFASQIKEVCAYCGVKLIYLKGLPKAPINGCTRWINNTPCIFLSDRHKRYDGFCFSLFHELGHVLLHGKKDIFLEEEMCNNAKDEREIDADKFASEYLLREVDYLDIKKEHNYSEVGIYQASTKYHVHPSIVVGRLHFDKELQYYTHNNLMKKINLCDN